ncbi:restriction endonuclease type II-like protein [Chytriomyces sp. MP71]|nr:restriction endonuclease type II-like protein [Chytriomyces sp. MP71]
MTPISRAIAEMPSSDLTSFALEGPSPILKSAQLTKDQKELLFVDSGPNPHVEKIVNPADDCVTVLVDNREIKCGVCSALKRMSKCRIEFRQLAAGDYIVSNRIAIERKSKSDLFQSAINKRVYQQLDLIGKMYNQPYLLIEMDDSGTESISTRNQFEGIIAGFLRRDVNVIFSHSKEDSAQIIFELAQGEARQGLRIAVPTNLPSKNTGAMALLLSIPGIGDATCFEIMQPGRFKTVLEFLSCDVDELTKRLPSLSKGQAKLIVEYVTRNFDENGTKNESTSRSSSSSSPIAESST